MILTAGAGKATFRDVALIIKASAGECTAQEPL